MFLLGLTLAAAAVPPAQSAPRTCLLSVDRKTYVRGRCLVFPMGGGSFTLNTAEGRKPVTHFAVVMVTGPSRGTASWNAKVGDLHAWDALGTVERQGACWINQRVRICAWK